MHGGRSNSGDLSRGHADPDTAPANGDAEIGVTGDDRPSHAGSEFGIVDRLGAVRPEVANFATETVECIDDYSLGGHRGVIACNGNYRFRFAF